MKHIWERRTKAMLKISNLEVNYGKMQVIKGISLEVKEG